MSAPDTPPKVVETLRLLLDNGWQVAAQRAYDTGGDAFIHVEARDPDTLAPLSATWHTRGSGGATYKWRSGLFNGQVNVPSVAKLHKIIQGDMT